MNSERRKSPRFILSGVAATLTLDPSLMPQAEMQGQVVDMSYNGIKIHLDSPIIGSLDGRHINIQLVLPESGIPLTIKGIIKHQVSSSEYGLSYDDAVSHEYLDEFIFECTKPLKVNKSLSSKIMP